jgi:hypothetical protein
MEGQTKSDRMPRRQRYERPSFLAAAGHGVERTRTPSPLCTTPAASAAADLPCLAQPVCRVSPAVLYLHR